MSKLSVGESKVQEAGRFLEPNAYMVWKWANIRIDFEQGFPKLSKGHITIWVIVYGLTKSAHFLSISMTFSQYKLVQLYEIPVSVTLDSDQKFIAKF